MNTLVPILLFSVTVFLLLIHRYYSRKITGTGKISAKNHGGHSSVAGPRYGAPPGGGRSQAEQKLWARMTLSAVLLAASLWIILGGGYDNSTQKWAYATIGMILGYWLKS